jgi:hypothetical protein
MTEPLMQPIEPDFSGWNQPWRTDSDRWWVTRRDALSRAQRDAGCAVTVSADNRAALDRLLGVHDLLATLAEELAERTRDEQVVTS